MSISFHSTDGLNQLPWQQITKLESEFHEDYPLKYSGRIFRVALGGGHAPLDPSSVVKLSEKQYAIPNAETLKLGSLEHYRQIEEAADGIGDEMEGRFSQDMMEFLSKTGVRRSPLSGDLSGSVTWEAGNRWLFCTSIEPSSKVDLQRMKETFGAHYVTRIENPSAFALELGRIVGANVEWSSLERDGPVRMFHMLRAAVGLERFVFVHHGRVLYTDRGVSYIGQLNELEKAVATCFIKRRRYKWQQEYRFAVSVAAKPDPDPFFVPVSPEIKKLAVGTDA